MKIGTITFHWATNYGAVLQAYALQQYLLSKNYETEIINYNPFRIKMLERLSWVKNLNGKQFKKEKLINKFRENELTLSSEMPLSNRDLMKLKDKYSHIIVGSDQVWNKGFTLQAEGKPTLSYFLNFAGNNCKRISYAASFGFDSADGKYVEVVKDEISKFSCISVRESTGISILNQMGLSGKVVCDPTLLLERTAYDGLANKSTCEPPRVFPFILHKNQFTAMSVVDTVETLVSQIPKEFSNKNLSVYDWLRCIRDSEVIVTNSFHAVMFALIFNKKFIVVPVEGSQMNNRITTVLNRVGLMDYFVKNNEKDKIRELLYRNVNWSSVNTKLLEMQKEGQEFLLNSIDISRYE